MSAVLGDVVAELVEAHHFLYLCPGVGLGRFSLVHLVLEKKYRIVNHIIAHCRYGTWYLQGYALPGRGVDLNENLVVFCCKVTTFFPVAVRFCPFQPDNAR